ncbi:photosystem II stability/assembly factor-like protein (plasmid) [Acidovorax sp. DW039]|uniref:WD40/YVTN/BNR-like repeat-containing protein n=1 Tax=Acidovorax sp. DW039 TaxID=3095606 RepID=UPI003091EED2|nr:photosystem II stability/assembly factor-like protein [Acidovorax sp. DW039]
MKNVIGVTRRVALLPAMGVGLIYPLAQAAERKVKALETPALKVARPTLAAYQAVTRADKRLVAVGERGLVVYSDDAGQSWKQASVPVSCTLTAVRFADAKRGWAVGNMGVVLTTDDAGESWRRCLDGQTAAQLSLVAARAQLEASKPGSDAMAQGNLLVEDAQRLVAEGADKPLLDLAFIDDGSLWVVGAFGMAFSSADGGRSWKSQIHRLPNPEGLSYYGLAQRNRECLLYGEQGLLVRAPQAVEPYTADTLPSNGSLFGSLALREGPLMLLGLRGKAWRSAEPGAPWAAVQTPVDASLVAGTQLTDGRVLLAGVAGQLLQSHDGGQHFRPLALSDRFPFTGLTEAEDGSLLLVGMRGIMRLTANELKTAAAPSSPAPARKSPV